MPLTKSLVMTKINDYIRKRLSEKKNTFVFCGGRRSGKTYGILQFLLLRCAGVKPFVVNIASMTSEQGRLGAYADCKNIISDHPDEFGRFEVFSSPREIRHPNGSRIFFNSYQNSETAKGIACDYLYLNEANNFSKQQYTDLLANVRKGVFIDYNPNDKFWVDDYFDDDDICHTTWKDNKFLTALQLEYFDNLKRLGTAPNASEIDKRNYEVYYLGNYYSMSGEIFHNYDFTFRDLSHEYASHMFIFCDPSALRGNDYFACVLCGTLPTGQMGVFDCLSINSGSREDVARKLMQWCREYDVEFVYIETNGLVGVDFFEFAQNSGLPVAGWYSRGNKFERICAQYQTIKTGLVVNDAPQFQSYFDQIYEFNAKCEHDDNIDAICSALTAQKMMC